MRSSLPSLSVMIAFVVFFANGRPWSYKCIMHKSTAQWFSIVLTAGTDRRQWSKLKQQVRAPFTLRGSCVNFPHPLLCESLRQGMKFCCSSDSPPGLVSEVEQRRTVPVWMDKPAPQSRACRSDSVHSVITKQILHFLQNKERWTTKQHYRTKQQ